MALTPDEVRAKLAEILAENFNVDAASVTPEATFRGTLGLDSLDVVDFVFFLQQGFGYEAKLNAYRDLHTVGDLTTFVIGKTSA
jgi:acyl carrier protein